jgi:hypothetical protein
VRERRFTPPARLRAARAAHRLLRFAAMMRQAMVCAMLLVASCGPRMVNHQVTSRTYAAPSSATCGQELASATFVGTGARWGEAIDVGACGVNGLMGYLTVQIDGGDEHQQRVGAEQPVSGRCAAALPVAASASSERGAGDGAVAGGGARAAAVAVATATATPVMVEVGDRADACFTSGTWSVGLGRVPKGASIRVRFWSKVPVELRGSMLRLTHSYQQPNVSDAAWEKHLEKEEARWRSAPRDPAADAALQAYLDERKAMPASAPPPPRAEQRPPMPSAHSEWIPGFWHWDRRDWTWVAGSWRVPERDETVTAPSPPPALRVELAPGAIAGLVWIPGYWAWDGGAYRWIPGAWARPPHAGLQWRGATWSARGRGVVFVPGGWR